MSYLFLTFKLERESGMAAFVACTCIKHSTKILLIVNDLMKYKIMLSECGVTYCI